MPTMPKGTDTISPSQKLILKHGERKLLMHRLSKYEHVVTMGRLEFQLSPIRPYMLLVDMADIEPGSTAGLVEVSRLAWDLVYACAGTPVIELREVPGYDGEPEGEEARIRFWDFFRNEEALERELGLEPEEAERAAKDAPPAPKDAKPTSKDAERTSKDSKSAPKGTKPATSDVKSAANDAPPVAKSDDGTAPKTPKSALKSPAQRVVKTEPKDTPLPPRAEDTRKDGKLEISIGDELSSAKFLVKPSSLVEKVLAGWATHSGRELARWRFEHGGKPLSASPAAAQTIGGAGIAHGDRIDAFAREQSIPFSIDWSSSSSNAGTMGFTMQPHVKIQKAIDVWCARLGFKEKDWVFEHCDEEIDLGEEPTLDDLGVEDGDAIYAIPAL